MVDLSLFVFLRGGRVMSHKVGVEYFPCNVVTRRRTPAIAGVCASRVSKIDDGRGLFACHFLFCSAFCFISFGTLSLF